MPGVSWEDDLATDGTQRMFRAVKLLRVTL